ncbi:hypothetical protein SAMN05216302_100419 [Nitrosomonas aestuarii]|uniref:Uncharacterized protein n=1 Tax=Nitrosomonas aestuarii TaxID=52441 RepID=A0A1I3YJ22_9PROT|nr:hypothetical protein SAMN05216302_100419 [Nitrosomonas aestuarii]
MLSETISRLLRKLSALTLRLQLHRKVVFNGLSGRVEA